MCLIQCSVLLVVLVLNGYDFVNLCVPLGSCNFLILPSIPSGHSYRHIHFLPLFLHPFTPSTGVAEVLFMPLIEGLHLNTGLHYVEHGTLFYYVSKIHLSQIQLICSTKAHIEVTTP